MQTYAELVKKARELHKQLGEDEFRRRYMNQPSSLAADLGLRSSAHSRAKAAYEIMNAFPFYSLQEHYEAVYKKILEGLGTNPLHVKTLGESIPDFAKKLRVLEARGLIRTKLMPVGKSNKVLVVTEAFDGREWKKAILPKKAIVVR